MSDVVGQPKERNFVGSSRLNFVQGQPIVEQSQRSFQIFAAAEESGGRRLSRAEIFSDL